jgi:hypothetical protein
MRRTAKTTEIYTWSRRGLSTMGFIPIRFVPIHVVPISGRYILSAFLQYLPVQWAHGTFSVFKFINEAYCIL